MENANYYINDNKNGNKIVCSEAIDLFNTEYEKSLNDKIPLSRGFVLQMIELEKRENISVEMLGKLIEIDIINGHILILVFDEDDEKYEHYYYINSKSPIALTYYPNLIDENLHKVPLNMFTENKEFVYEVIKDFFDGGNTQKIRENYVKNKNEMNKYKQI